MALKLTRSQYQEIYGTSVPTTLADDSELDTTPAPVRLTRAEYNAKYRPKELGFFAEAGQDISETLTNIRQAGTDAREEDLAIDERVATGETSVPTSLFQKFGSALSSVGEIAFESILGVGKALLPEKGAISEQSIGNLVDDAGTALAERAQSDIQKLRDSERQENRDLAKQIDEFIYYYNNDNDFQSTVNAAGGIFEGLLSATGFRPAIRGTEKIRESATDLAKRGTDEVKQTADRVFTVTDDAAIKRDVASIRDIEEKNKSGRQLNDFTDDAGESSRSRIVRSGVLQGAVDEDGLIRTKQPGGPVEQYKNIVIDGAEDVVKRILIKEGNSINVNEVREYLKSEISDAGLEGAALTRAINGIEREIEGLSLRADEFGNLLLEKVQDAKISTTQNINYLTDATPTVKLKKAVARAYKQIIEEKSLADIKEINKELGVFYGDLKRLENLDGKRTKGGRLGKYFSSLGGQIVGGAAGSVGGAAGAGLGAIVGGEIASAATGRSLRNTFGRSTPQVPEKNPILERAKRTAEEDINLRVPDKVVGLPEGVPETAETRKIVKQLSDNVKQQNTAIKAGNFELVATLKDIYRSLATRLKNYINDYIENIDENISPGLSIRNSVTPENVAKNIDEEDFIKINRFLEDPVTEQLDVNILTMFEGMGIRKADLDTQVRFLKEVTDEAERSGRLNDIQNSPRRNLNQSDAPMTPTTAQNAISDTVDEIDTDVNAVSPQTTLLEEAKKYDSAEQWGGAGEYLKDSLNGYIAKTPDRYDEAGNFVNGNTTFVSPKGRIELDIKDRNGEIKLFQIIAKEKGTGLGTDIVKSLKDYSDLSGKKLTIVQPNDYWKRFDWLTPTRGKDKYGKPLKKVNPDTPLREQVYSLEYNPQK